MQHTKVLGYYSKAFRGTQINWAIIVKEAHAIYRALEHFKDMFTGCQVNMACDHQPLQNFALAATNSCMINHWSLSVQQFAVSITWIESSKNTADSLSQLME